MLGGGESLKIFYLQKKAERKETDNLLVFKFFYFKDEPVKMSVFEFQFIDSAFELLLQVKHITHITVSGHTG